MTYSRYGSAGYDAAKSSYDSAGASGMSSDQARSSALSSVSTPSSSAWGTPVSTTVQSPSPVSSVSSSTQSGVWGTSVSNNQSVSTSPSSFYQSGGGGSTPSNVVGSSGDNTNVFSQQNFDVDAYNEYLKSKGLSIVPYSSAEKEEYVAPFSIEDIRGLFTTIQNQNYSYDPAKDTLLQMSQDQAMSQTAQNMAARGMLYSDSAKTKMFQAGMQLTPQFEQIAYNRYSGNLNDLYNQLTTMQGIEQDSYNRYRSEEQDRLALEEENRTRFFEDAGYAKDTFNQSRQNYFEEVKRTEEQEIRDFGVVLSPDLRNQVANFKSMKQEDLRRLLPLGEQEGGFATTINQLMRTDPKNPDLPLLNTLRAMKILSDPSLLNKYGAEYGMDTMATQQMGMNRDILLQQQMSAEKQAILDEISSLIKTQKEQAEVDKIIMQIAEIEKNMQYKDAQTTQVQLENIRKEIEISNLPKELKAKLDLVISQTNNQYSQIGSRALDDEVKRIETEADFYEDAQGNVFRRDYSKSNNNNIDLTDKDRAGYDFKKDPNFQQQLNEFYADPVNYMNMLDSFKKEYGKDFLTELFNGQANYYMLNEIQKYKKGQVDSREVNLNYENLGR